MGAVGPRWRQGQGMPNKTPHPWLLSRIAWGKGPGACVLRGSVCPVTNSNSCQENATVEAENKSNRMIDGNGNTIG